MKLKDWREMLPLAAGIYDKHAAGCCWHIVLDDGNVDDASVEFVAGWMHGNRHCTTPKLCAELLPLMRRASKTQRSKVASKAVSAHTLATNRRLRCDGQ